MAIIMTPPPVPAPEDPASNAPPTLTVTYYQQLAAHFSEIIDEVSAIIPRAPGPPLDAQFVRTHLNIPIKFLGTVVSSVEQVTSLRTAGKLDVAKGRNTLQLLEAFQTIRYKVAAFIEELEHALNSSQASLAVDSLDAYDLAKSLIRDPSNAALTSWVDNMQADLGRRGPRKKKTPVPAPVPAPVPTAITAPAKAEGWNG
jgi:hypothetical protein